MFRGLTVELPAKLGFRALYRFLAIVAFGTLVLSAALWFSPSSHTRLTLTTCLQDAAGLRAGAPVRIAGVDVGRVKSVTARPEQSACPADVEMAFTVGYGLRIPRDSVATTATDGVLGPTYIEIETTQAIGSAVENGGILPSRETRQMSLSEMARALQALAVTAQAASTVQGQETEPTVKHKLPVSRIRPQPKREK
jgi:ABC-type transporter Mla subunit MlaD